MSTDVIDRQVLKIGSIGGVVGSLVGMVGNLIHPATPLYDPHGLAGAIAESDAWFPIHFAIVIGLILMFGGLLAVYQSLRQGPSGGLALFGLISAIVGIAIGLLLVTLDGVAAKHLAEEWATAAEAERATALRIVLASESLNFAIASAFNVSFAGVTFILFGLAVAWSETYPRWLGWIVVPAGVGSIGAGLIQGAAGEPTPWSRILTIFGPTIITLWLLSVSMLILRRERRSDPLVPAVGRGRRDRS